MEGVSFSPEDLDTAVETTDIDTEIGSLVSTRLLPYSLLSIWHLAARLIAIGEDEKILHLLKSHTIKCGN
jgi:hypothetical protein